jgi:hypothetical protein
MAKAYPEDRRVVRVDKTMVAFRRAHPFDHDRLSGAITLKTMKSSERYRPFGQAIRN